MGQNGYRKSKTDWLLLVTPLQYSFNRSSTQRSITQQEKQSTQTVKVWHWRKHIHQLLYASLTGKAFYEHKMECHEV